MSTFARVLAALVLIGLMVAIGVGVYNAGVTRRPCPDREPPSRPARRSSYYRAVLGHPGAGGGFGFFGIFFWILGIFLIFGLLRAAFGWGRGWPRLR